MHKASDTCLGLDLDARDVSDAYGVVYAVYYTAGAAFRKASDTCLASGSRSGLFFIVLGLGGVHGFQSLLSKAARHQRDGRHVAHP